MPGLKRNPLPETPHWLRANVQGEPEAIDREAMILRGYVVAQEGVLMEPDPRGEFDKASLREIVKLMKVNKEGTKMRFGHPSMSGDALGTFLGRAKSPRMSTVTVIRDGQEVELAAVRADGHLSPSAGEGNPNGDLAGYVAGLVEEDPKALASSLVLQWAEEVRLDSKGRPKLDDNGNPLPPLLRPTRIHASDIVDEGAAVDAILSPGADLPRAAIAALNRQFAGVGNRVVEARLTAWMGRYLAQRADPDPPDEEDDDEPDTDVMPGERDRLELELRLIEAGD